MLDSNQRMQESKSCALPLGECPLFQRVDNGTRTHNNQNHNLALCQLNYIHHNPSLSNVPAGIRTPDTRLRRAVLYPAELLAQIEAGRGNRTPITSLEGWSFTTKLYPHNTQIASAY